MLPSGRLCTFFHTPDSNTYFFFSKNLCEIEILNFFFRAFAADFAEEERERDRKEAEAKDIEHNKMFKDAFERIKQVYLEIINLYI